MHESDVFRANPSLRIRDDFDDFAILFDPHSGKAFGLNPVGEFIWKLLKNEVSIAGIIRQVKTSCRNVSSDAESEVYIFIEKLVKNGLIGKRI